MQNLRGILVRGSIALVVLAAPAAAGAATTGSITVYSGQHEQTSASSSRLREAQPAIQVKRPLQRRGPAREPAPAGGLGLARRRVLRREPAGAHGLEQQRAAGARRRRTTLAKVPARCNSPQHDWVGVSARSVGARLQHQAGPAASSRRSMLDLAEPAWKGRSASRRRRPTSSR